MALQAQLDSLVAHVESCHDANTSPGVAVDHSLHRPSISLDGQITVPPLNDSIVHSAPINATNVATNVARPATSAGSPSKNGTRRFCGPTSPDYSLNVAEIKLRQVQGSSAGAAIAEDTNPSLEDDEEDDDERPTAQEGQGSNVQGWLTTNRLRQCIMQLPRLLAKHETLRLLNVYQEVMGQLHPIVDLKRLIDLAEACYNQNPKIAPDWSILQENTVLILFLALIIGLTAETVSQSYVAKTLYKSIEHLVKLKLASEVSSVDQVLVALLAVWPLR